MREPAGRNGGHAEGDYSSKCNKHIKKGLRTMSSTDSYTDRERRHHTADGGFTAALAIAHQVIAAECRDLPEGLLAAGANQYFYAVTGTIEERHAAVDAWAARHHVPAGWNSDLGYYCARVSLGASSMMAVATPVSEMTGLDSPAEDERSDKQRLVAA